VSAVYLLPIGSVPPQVLGWVEATIVEWCPWPIKQLDSLPFPENSYDLQRAQYKSVEIMKAVAMLRRMPCGFWA